ncbi:MAG: glycosyltransferase family 87 protein, partial [Anaerolineae bacterium]
FQSPAAPTGIASTEVDARRHAHEVRFQSPAAPTGIASTEVDARRHAHEARFQSLSLSLPLAPAFLLLLIAAASLLLYRQAAQAPDLRRVVPQFLFYFGLLFVLYLAAVILVLRLEKTQGAATPVAWLFIILLSAVAFRVTLLPTRPTLSDDMYRYIWDGRVQAAGLSPYRYTPAASELTFLRRNDNTIWRYINRKTAITIYPPAAQLAFLAIYRLHPDSVTWTKTALTLAELSALVPLALWLRRQRLSLLRLLILAWSPLAVFEVAGSGHMDALVLAPLVVAWLAFEKRRPALLGFSLGIAALLKLYPAFFLPLLWTRRDVKAPLAFAGTVAAGYALFIGRGGSVLGFLPNYLNERFNTGPAALIARGLEAIGGPEMPSWRVVQSWQLLFLALLAVWALWQPLNRPATARRRAWAVMTVFFVLSQNLFSWYLLMLMPLLALDLRRGRWGLALDAPTGWLLFTGLTALSYTFFITWHPVPWAIWAQYGVLLLFLAGHAWRRRGVHR